MSFIFQIWKYKCSRYLHVNQTNAAIMYDSVAEFFDTKHTQLVNMKYAKAIVSRW